MNILYYDKSIAVIEKPPGMLSQPDKSGETSLLDEAAGLFGYAALINRLDRGVGGVVLLALNKSSAANMSKQIVSGICKHYVAVVCGNPDESAELTNYIIKNERLNTSAISPKSAKGAKEAKLTYMLKERLQTANYGCVALVSINLITGRHHQIRVQLSNAGIPVWGDVKYNRHFNKRGLMYKAALDEGITIKPALWANKMTVIHPISLKELSFESNPHTFPFTLFDSIV